MFRNFQLVKKDKIAYKSTTTGAREKDMRRFGIISILTIMGFMLKIILFYWRKLAKKF
jgi:hypothetical protein